MPENFRDPFENQSNEPLLNRDDFAAELDAVYPASGGIRFINYLIDSLGVFLFQIFGTQFLMQAFFGENPNFEDDVVVSSFFLLYLGGGFIYYAFFEAMFQKTPGKFLTRTKVVTVDGGKPAAKEIFIRSISRYVPFEAFSFLSSDAVGWHDYWSRTRVIKG
ncbi:MAG: RDD family protein [Bacteroidota bacterium]